VLKILSEETLGWSRFCFMAKIAFSGYPKIHGIDDNAFQFRYYLLNRHFGNWYFSWCSKC